MASSWVSSLVTVLTDDATILEVACLSVCIIVGWFAARGLRRRSAGQAAVHRKLSELHVEHFGATIDTESEVVEESSKEDFEKLVDPQQLCEQYGLFGARPGAWSVFVGAAGIAPCGDSVSTDAEDGPDVDVSSMADEADELSHHTAADEQELDDEQAYECDTVTLLPPCSLFEHYSLFDAPVGMWTSQESWMEDSNEEADALSVDACDSVHALLEHYGLFDVRVGPWKGGDDVLSDKQTLDYDVDLRKFGPDLRADEDSYFRFFEHYGIFDADPGIWS